MGNDLDERSDIYSLGCTIYEALTGHVPLLGQVAVETMKMHIDQEPKLLSLRNPSVPKELDGIVMKALKKDPAQRYQTMGEFKDELERFADSYGAYVRTRKGYSASKFVVLLSSCHISTPSAT